MPQIKTIAARHPAITAIIAILGLSLTVTISVKTGDYFTNADICFPEGQVEDVVCFTGWENDQTRDHLVDNIKEDKSNLMQRRLFRQMANYEFKQRGCETVELEQTPDDIDLRIINVLESGGCKIE